MKIFMAGGISGNLKPFWTIVGQKMAEGMPYDEAKVIAMQVFIAGIQGQRKSFVIDALLGDDEQMKLYLVSQNWFRQLEKNKLIMNDEDPDGWKPYILESFYYSDETTERLLPHFGDFLLDSGAFTFMQGNGGAVNWDEYIERYADFIKRNHIQKYFELDIDTVVGYDRVKEIRKKLEKLTGIPCIPVWHLSRGLDEYRRMCDEYDYVAIGGIVSGEIKKEKYGALPALISEAHKRNAKIHGLGFTALDWLKKCHFDSVDSTAWTTGNRFGFIYWFDGQTMRKKDAPKGHRLGDSRRVALNNYTEWLKFQKYADTHL